VFSISHRWTYSAASDVVGVQPRGHRGIAPALCTGQHDPRPFRQALLGRPQVAILDVHDTRAALTEVTVKEVEHYAKRAGATFELRFDDGSVTIPANGQIYP